MATNDAPVLEAPVLVERVGHITQVTLNRPRAINALTTEMVELVIVALEQAAADGSTAVVITGAGERGLCGGGDIKLMAEGGGARGREFIEREYVLDLMTSESPIPVIGLMDGITMGGGIGLTAHGAIRIVTERSLLAMPETRIGIVPDVGGHLLLSRSPGALGEYLATVGAHMSAGDAIWLGFADHFVEHEHLHDLVLALAEHGSTEAEVHEIVSRFASPAPASALAGEQQALDALYAEALAGAPGHDAGHEALAVWAVEAAQRLLTITGMARPELAAQLREMSPTSVAVTLAQLHRTRELGLTLEEVLRDDLRVCSRLFLGDFTEGVRARVIDKDNAPNWNPARIEDLDASEIARIIDPAG